MKKFAALFLAIVLTFLLVACGIEVTPLETDGTDKVPEQTQTEGTNAEDKTPENETAFTEIVVVDNEECTIKITGIDPNGFWGYTLKVFMENKSKDTTYMFSVDNAFINGVQSDPFWASEVAPGKKANSEISFADSVLEENGVGEFTDIELIFSVSNSNDWDANDVANETIHVYPYGEDKATTFVRDAQDTDNVLVDNEYVTVIVTGYEIDELFGYAANLFLVNKTDTSVMYSVDEVSVNGFMVDPFYATSVAPGKCAFSSIYWDYSTLEDNGIPEVEEIEFVLYAYDEMILDRDYFVDEVVTLNP